MNQDPGKNNLPASPQHGFPPAPQPLHGAAETPQHGSPPALQPLHGAAGTPQHGSPPAPQPLHGAAGTPQHGSPPALQPLHGAAGIENWLRAHDPALGVPPRGFSPRRARVVVFTMRHPVAGWLWLHHRGVSRAAAIVLVAAVLAALLSMRARERRALPPVALGVAPAEETAPVGWAELRELAVDEAPPAADDDPPVPANSELPPPPAVSFPDGPPRSDVQ